MERWMIEDAKRETARVDGSKRKRLVESVIFCHLLPYASPDTARCIIGLKEDC